mmetsp:Transcript_38600/g.50595  ORF Transcript_38600/g.50595 Transcript_38600/m.50595 type:complete len:177 (-) Transcript_38600:561-1091(-)
MLVKKSEVTAQDKAISLGSITEFDNNELFDFEANGFQPVDNWLSTVPNQQQLVTISLSRDLTVMKRFNYGIMNAIVQLGSFLFLFSVFMMMIMSIFAYDEAGYHLASHLYRRRTSDSRQEDMRRSRCTNFQGYFLDRCLTRPCRFWYVNNSSVDERALERARMAANKEVSTVELVR